MWHFDRRTLWRQNSSDSRAKDAAAGSGYAWLYLIIALPLAFVLTWRVPPFQGPDENNHFLRAVQIAQFGFAAIRLPEGVLGGRLPAGAERLAHGFEDLRFQPEVEIDRIRLARAERVEWGAAVESGFANTAIYPPVFYVPQALAIRLARAAGMTVLGGLRAARLANALASIALGWLAIRLATGPGRLLLFWLLCLPMSLSLIASCSQDGLAISGACAAAAWMSRPASLPARSALPAVSLAALLGCLAAAKPPMVTLAPLAAFWAVESRVSTRLGLLALPLAICFGWVMFGAGPVIAPNHAVQQLHYLLAHPACVVAIATATLRRDDLRLANEFVGVLGWLDVRLPAAFAKLAAMLLLIILAASVSGPDADRRSISTSRRIAPPLLLILACCAAIGATLYLDWTPVGAARVEGLQGRYFIPPAAFIVLVLGRSQRFDPASFRLLLPLWGVCCALSTILAVETHYRLVAHPAFMAAHPILPAP